MEPEDGERVMAAQLVGFCGDHSLRATFSYITGDPPEVTMAYYLNGQRRSDVDMSWMNEKPLPGAHYAAGDLPKELDAQGLFGWTMDQIAAENPARPRPREFEVERYECIFDVILNVDV